MSSESSSKQVSFLNSTWKITILDGTRPHMIFQIKITEIKKEVENIEYMEGARWCNG